MYNSYDYGYESEDVDVVITLISYFKLIDDVTAIIIIAIISTTFIVTASSIITLSLYKSITDYQFILLFKP